LCLVSNECTVLLLLLLLFLLLHLEHRASVKRFTLLQFLNLRQSVGLLGREISTSQGRYLTQTQNKHRHPCLEWDSNPWTQCSSGRRYFMSYTRRPLWSAMYSYGKTNKCRPKPIGSCNIGIIFTLIIIH
jgi:hypothetical protein